MPKTPTPTSPSRFGCTNPDDPTTFHLILCGNPYAHSRVRPDDIAVLWDWFDTEVSAMLALEEVEPINREAWASHDARASLIWAKIEELSRQVKRIHTVPFPDLPKTDKIDFAKIKERIDLVAYISQYTELRPAGRTYKGKCPLPDHQDDSPSFTVYPDSKSWWCFGCQQGSDIFDFAKKMHGHTAKDLART